MDLSKKLALSYYKTIAVLNEPHQIYLVQHQSTKKIYIKKVLTIYQREIYDYLYDNSIIGIPHIIDLFEDDSRLIVIEEYISGSSLEDIIQSHSFSADDILNCMLDLCSIVEQLHSHEPPIIHRDIKPSNIIRTSCSCTVLLDFNASKFYSELSERDTILLGTQGYAAPEQYGFGASSPRTDIYALGIVLKELVDSLPKKDSRFDSIIEKCIPLDPVARYTDISMLKQELLQLKSPLKAADSTVLSNISFTLPGFRSHTAWKRMLAIAGYLILLYNFFTFDPEGVKGAALWLERICFTGFVVLILFSFTNYRNIRSRIPFGNHKNLWIRYIALVLFNAIAIFILMVFMLLIEDHIL